jgi:hypothetical protein
MQDPICAMKICGGINGDFSTVTSRPELRVAWQHEHGDAYPIDSQFASDAGGLFIIDGQTIG